MMEKQKPKKFKKLILIFSIILCSVFALLMVSGSVIYKSVSLDVAKLTSINNGIRVYSATGEDATLYNSNRSIVEIDTLPDYVLNAFIDTEDKNFYKHHGYDFKRICKAMLVNFTTHSKSQGASTISQQLVKNALLNNEKTYKRKLEELVLSIKMEKQFTKQDILQMYLNTIYFGSNAYGIENASTTYFGKSAKDLSLSEACCLAGLIKSPAKYSPKTNMQNAVERRNLVASLMKKNGHITDEQLNDVVSAPINVIMGTENEYGYEKEAIYEACKLLNITERELINRDYQIITNKDDALQAEVIRINREILTETEQKCNESLDSISVVVDDTGKIVAYYCNSNYNLHNIKRQPASTLKPFAVYYPCIKYNILCPATQLLDEEINYSGFSPKNADNQFHGYISVRESLSKSLNIPAVKALDYIGVEKSMDSLMDFGFLLSNEDKNLSLALGATKNGVGIMDLVSAYSTLACVGVQNNLTFIDKILDKDGNIIYENENYKDVVASAEDCFLITDMLKETAKSGTARRLNSLNLPVASKTGTATNGTNVTDLYNVAYTTKHTVLTWIADINKNEITGKLYSSVEPTEINKQILAKLYNTAPPPDFAAPEGVERCAYDLFELTENHNLVAPTTNLQRYITYDYFKTSNKPQVVTTEQMLNLSAEISKFGCELSFNANKHREYTVYKCANNNSTELCKITDSGGRVSVKDTAVFKYETITYYILDENMEVVAETKVFPQDYLINTLNSTLKSGKKKWAV